MCTSAGTDEFDVAAVDPGSLLLSRTDGTGGSVARQNIQKGLDRWVPWVPHGTHRLPDQDECLQMAADRTDDGAGVL